MLLQLENTNQANINKLLEFAKKNHLQLSLIDDSADNTLPGTPLTPKQLKQLIANSRKSGMISMDNAHQIIRSKYNAG